MFIKNSSLQRALLLVLMIFLVMGAAGARELRYATGYPPNTTAIIATELAADALEKYSDGALKLKIYPGSLLNFQETSAGIRDGMADSGLVFMSYFPAEFPHANFLAELTMLLELENVSPENAGLAYVGAISEFILKSCPQCVSEFKRQNQVYLGGASSPPYWLLCNKAVRTSEEVKGKRLRAGGAQWARWASAMGGTSVTISANDVYEALSQGVIDCSMTVTTELSVWSLKEVVSHITVKVPGGVYGASAVNNVNSGVWRSLSEKDRWALLRASAVMTAQTTWLYTKEGMDNLEAAKSSSKIQVHEPSSDLLEATRAFIEQDLHTIADAYTKKYNVKNAKDIISEFRPVLEKWVELVRDVNSGEELADLYWEEAFSKVDVNTYGL